MTGRPRAAEPVGRRAGRGRDAVRGRRRRGAARCAAEGRAGDDVHGVARPAADGPEHVQDRRRVDADGDPCRGPHDRHACTVDLRRPLRRDARPHHRLGDAVARRRCRRRTTSRWSPTRRRCGRGCRSCTSSTGSAPATRSTRSSCWTTTTSLALVRAGRSGRVPAAGDVTRRAVRAGHGSEPGCLLPGPGGVEPVPRRGAGHRPGRLRRARGPHRPALRTGRVPGRPRCRAGRGRSWARPAAPWRRRSTPSSPRARRWAW